MPVTPTSYKHNSQLIGFSGSYPTANPLPVVLRGSERACIYHQVCLPSFVSLLDDSGLTSDDVTEVVESWMASCTAVSLSQTIAVVASRLAVTSAVG